MRVFVTGGTGFIGRNLIGRLRDDGDEVVALARSGSKAEEISALGARPVIGDLDDRAALDTGLVGADRVFHLAGLVKARGEADYLCVNRDGTRNLLEAARGAEVSRFVLVSSLAAAGPSVPGRRRADDDPPHPVTAYGRSKLAGEQVVRESALPWTIVRPPMVYGPHDVEVFKLLRLVRRGLAPVFGDGTQELSAIYASDLVDALVACAKTDGAGRKVFCACHREIFTSLELVRAVARALDRKVRVIRLRPGLARALLGLIEATAGLAGRATVLNRDKANEFLAPAWTGDPEPLERETGWRASHDLARGLTRTVAWCRERGWM